MGISGGKCEPSNLVPQREREIEEELAKGSLGPPLGSWYRQRRAAFVIHLIAVADGCWCSSPFVPGGRLGEADATSQLAWAGADGEMLDFIGQVIKSTS